MSAESTRQHFHYEGRDGVASELLWIMPVLAAPYLCSWGWQAGVCLSLACVVLGAGMRSSLDVTSERAVLVRKLFFIPYWKHSSRGIDDVWFDGDWGLAESSGGVVVLMDGKERSIGNRRDMEQLVDGLMPFTRFGRNLG